MNDNKNTTVLGFLIYPGFPMSCLTSMIEPLRAANEIVGLSAFTWKLISEMGNPVVSSAKISFDPDISFSNVTDMDYLFLLSDPLAKFEQPKASNGLLRRLVRHGMRIGGVSGGVFPLARSGLLDGYTCSVHWCYEAAFALEFPSHKMKSDVIIIDRNRYTVSGATAGFDLMLHLIEEKLGSEVMTEVACWFQHPLVRGEGVRQRIPTRQRESTSDMLPSMIHKAIEIFTKHIEDPVSILDVAELIDISPRQLERIFKKTTGKTPLQYYRMLRLNTARQLVLYSKNTMREIAEAVGYTTATPMIKRYQEIFKITPQLDREKINIFRVKNNRPVPS